MPVALKWMMTDCICVLSVERNTVRNVLRPMEQSRISACAQTAKRSTKVKKTTGAGSKT